MSKSLSQLTWVTIGYDRNRGINELNMLAMSDTLAGVLEHAKKHTNYNIEAFEISDARKFADECVAWLQRVSGVPKEIAVSVTLIIGAKIAARMMELSAKNDNDTKAG